MEEKAPDIFKVLDKIVARVPAGANNIIFTPWLYGERSPVEDCHIRASLFNLSLENTRADILRAVFEGVAFNSKWLLDPVEKLMGRPFQHLNFIGGGANSDVWSQIIADVLDRKIRQVKDPIYSNARGAAFLASIALKYITLEDIPQYIKIKAEYTPNPDNRKIYDEVFAEFLNHYKTQKKACARMNKQAHPVCARCQHSCNEELGGYDSMEYAEIMKRKDVILSRPVQPIPKDKLASEHKLYAERCKRSIEIFEKAKAMIPGGVEHNLSQNKPFPLAMDRAKGYKIWDVDGNEYIDYLMCGAPIILGHSFEPLDEKIIEIIRQKGPATGLTSEYELLAAEEIIKHMPGVEMVRFLQSGTEADMAALSASPGPLPANSRSSRSAAAITAGLIR